MEEQRLQDSCFLGVFSQGLENLLTQLCLWTVFQQVAISIFPASTSQDGCDCSESAE